MALKDFNINPYYDDFDEAKKFLRILFRPGYAVQARELTQLQTILQNQVSRFGDNIFKNGSLVTGGELTYSNSVKFLKLKTLDANNNTISANNFNGKIITNDTGYVGFTIYFVVLAHGKFLLLEGIHDLRIMLEEMQKEYPRRETKADTLNKEKTDEKLG